VDQCKLSQGEAINARLSCSANSALSAFQNRGSASTSVSRNKRCSRPVRPAHSLRLSPPPLKWVFSLLAPRPDVSRSGFRLHLTVVPRASRRARQLSAFRRPRSRPTWRHQRHVRTIGPARSRRRTQHHRPKQPEAQLVRPTTRAGLFT